MPEPKAGESKQDFISRCMVYPDMQNLEQDARYAKCNGMWEQAQKKDYAKVEERLTYDISDVEIGSVGKWNGDDYSEKDFDDMVEAQTELFDVHKPYLKLGHDKTQKLLQQDGLPAAGWVHKLKRSGDKLLCDFVNVPQKIYELLKRKAYKRISPEIYWNVLFEGKKFRRVLKAASILGANIPAMNNLDDILNLYSNDKLQYEELKTYDNENKVEYEILKDYYRIEDDNMENQIIENLQTEVKEYKEREKSYEADVKTYKEENEQLKKDKENLEGEVKELTSKIETREKEQKDKDIKLFIDKAVEDKKILPSQIKEYTELASDNFESVQKIIENMPELINTDEESQASEKLKKYEAMTDEEKDEFKVKKANEYMKENEVDFKDALIAVEQQLGE